MGPSLVGLSDATQHHIVAIWIEGILLILGSVLLKVAPKQRTSWVRIWPIPDEDEILSSLLPWVSEQKTKLKKRAVVSHSIDDYRYHAYECSTDLLVIAITDNREDDQIITGRVRRLGKKVRNTLKNQSVTKVLKNYPDMATPFLESKLVVALVGTRGVGKTAAMHLLLGKRPPQTYIPTMGMNAETVDGMQISNCTVDLWDLGGDDHVNKVWESCLANVDLVLLFTDSTLKNVLDSQKMMSDIMDNAEAASLAVIANKQDLPNSLAPSVVRKVFNQVVHPLVAIDLTQHGVAELVLEQSLISHTELMTQK
ncbi:MAG: ADP-ribosylation factor-like protein [Candidatus Thorarchaeota archaeon]|jgi:small GTP-binding protein